MSNQPYSPASKLVVNNNPFLELKFTLEHRNYLSCIFLAVRKHADKHILPLECLYLNKNALNAQVGHISQPTKHFTLKRKPKAAVLRAELLQKCKFINNLSQVVI